MIHALKTPSQADSWSSPRLPACWDEVPLKYLALHVSRGNTPTYVDQSTTQVLNQACIHWSGLAPENCKYHGDSDVQGFKGLLQHGDVVINSTGTGTLGRVQVFDLPGTWIADGHVTIIRTDPIILTPRFLSYFLTARPTQDYINAALAVGATNQIELNVDRLRTMKVPVPPLPEQRAIADYLDRETERIDALGKRLGLGNNSVQPGSLAALLIERRESLIAAVITGQIEVPPSGISQDQGWNHELRDKDNS